MRKFVMLLGIPFLALLSACNKADETPATQAESAAATADASPAVTASAGAAQESAAAEPQIVTLASGEQLEVISVGYFDENMKELGGLVAIAGRVKEAYPDHGALILVDCANMAGCTDGCCPQAEVPVRLELSEYTGELPPADAEVVLVGDLTVQELGYELAVREIHQGANTVLALKS